MGKLNLKKATKRLVQYAAVIGQEAPASLLCPDGAPSPELLKFCDATGASLDWIFCGDISPMIRDSFASATKAACKATDEPTGRDNETQCAINHLLSCMDELNRAMDMAELLFLAGSGIRDAEGSAISRAAELMQGDLTAAKDFLEAVQTALSTPHLAEGNVA